MQIDRPIAIAVICFAVLLLVYFLVMPEYKIFRSLQAQLAEKTAEYNAEHDYYATISRVYFDLQSKKDDIKKIDDALPSDPNLGKLVYFIQRAASESGLMVKSLFLSKSSQVSTQNTKNAVNTIKEISFSTNMLGDYHSLQSFLIALERSARLFEVTNISFGSASQIPQESGQFQAQQTYSFSLEIKTHSY